MRRLTLSCSLAALLLGACGPRVLTTPAPTPDPGARIRFLTLESSEYVYGRLTAFAADSMAFEQRVPGENGFEWKPMVLATDSVAQLQVRVGRKANGGRGAVIGGAIGLGLGMACAAIDDPWVQPSAGECLVSGVVSGAGTGFLIGLLVRSDVWAPTSVPNRREQPGPVVMAGPTRLGLRIPVRLGR